MNVAEILYHHARDRPNALAIVDTTRGKDQTWSFAALDRAAAQRAALLDDTGLKPGDAVLVLQPMSAELYITLVAIFRLGLIAMFLDPVSDRRDIERSLELNRPRGLIAGTKAHFLRLLCPALRRIPFKFSVGSPLPGTISLRRARHLEPRDVIQTCGLDTPALLTFTSGSTGQPKAAVRSHGFLLAQHRALTQESQAAPGEMDLGTLPLFVLANLASGITSVIPKADLRYPAAVDPASVVTQMQHYRPTRVSASPAFLERLIEYCDRYNRDLPRVEKIFVGGAPVFPRLVDALHKVAPSAEVIAVYGSTEAEPIAYVERDEITPEDKTAMISGHGLLVGRPVAAIRVRILPDRWGEPIGPYTRDEFEAVCLGPSEVGEIVVTGEHVLTGYLGGRGDEETKFSVEGTRWHRTGDAGYLDQYGRLWLLGRCAARITDISGTVYPLSVECAARQCAGVRCAALVAERDRRVLAVELADPALDVSYLEKTVRKLGVHAIRVLKRIPVDRRHNSKIDYPRLNKLLHDCSS